MRDRNRRVAAEASITVTRQTECLICRVTPALPSELNKLKAYKAEIEKISDMFLSHNMVDAKRKIKK